MLTKKTNGVANGPRLSKALAGVVGSAMDRRTFLRRSGLAAGGAAAFATMSSGMVKKAEAQSDTKGDPTAEHPSPDAITQPTPTDQFRVAAGRRSPWWRPLPKRLSRAADCA